MLGSACSEVQIQLKSEAKCGGINGGVVSEGSCSAATQAVDSALFMFAVDPSCPVSGGEISGEVVEEGAQTVCCTP